MFKRVTLFHFFGFKIKADASWIFISVLLSWTMSNTIYPTMLPGQTIDAYQVMGIVTLVGIIISVIAHELGHAVIAEYYDMPIESITFFIFGGVAEMKGEPSHPKGEFLMAIAGPIVSVFMGLFFWALSDLCILYISPGAAAHVLHYLGNLNMLIATFNMIPAFPLDGGRALRAIIWKRRNNLVLATRIASQWGAFFSYALIAIACHQIVMEDDLVNGMWLAIFAYFIYAAGDFAVKHTESLSVLAEEPVTRFMQHNVLSVSPDLTINELIDKHISQRYQKVFPVVEKGALVGAITLPAVLSLDRSKWPWLHVSSVMETLGPQNLISPDGKASDAFAIMHKSSRELLLVAQDRKLLGVIFFRDLANYMTIVMKVDYNKPVEKSR